MDRQRLSPTNIKYAQKGHGWGPCTRPHRGYHECHSVALPIAHVWRLEHQNWKFTSTDRRNWHRQGKLGPNYKYESTMAYSIVRNSGLAHTKRHPARPPCHPHIWKRNWVIVHRPGDDNRPHPLDRIWPRHTKRAYWSRHGGNDDGTATNISRRRQKTIQAAAGNYIQMGRRHVRPKLCWVSINMDGIHREKRFYWKIQIVGGKYHHGQRRTCSSSRNFPTVGSSNCRGRERN
jgi:hypothetical protein